MVRSGDLWSRSGDLWSGDLWSDGTGTSRNLLQPCVQQFKHHFWGPRLSGSRDCVGKIIKEGSLAWRNRQIPRADDS